MVNPLDTPAAQLRQAVDRLGSLVQQLVLLEVSFRSRPDLWDITTAAIEQHLAAAQRVPTESDNPVRPHPDAVLPPVAQVETPPPDGT